jgi:hypothetical protein
MALAPLSAATKPITSKGLFNAAKGQTYEQWRASAGANDAMPSIAPGQVDDSVTNKVNTLTAQSSPLMQAAKTEGLKIANRRGLLNSSIAAGATQDAMLRHALPIASQEASQDHARNLQARDFEYGMASQGFAQDFQSGESALDRGLQERMQGRDIESREKLTLAQIASTEGMAAAQRALDDRMQQRQLDTADRQQIRDIASREGLAAAERALQEKLQGREIAHQTAERKLDRQLQEKLASWNLSSTDRNAAAQFLSNMESLYAAQFDSIMANTALSDKQRSEQLQSAKALRDKQLNFVQQMYNVKLTW